MHRTFCFISVKAFLAKINLELICFVPDKLLCN